MLILNLITRLKVCVCCHRNAVTTRVLSAASRKGKSEDMGKLRSGPLAGKLRASEDLWPRSRLMIIWDSETRGHCLGETSGSQRVKSSWDWNPTFFHSLRISCTDSSEGESVVLYQCSGQGFLLQVIATSHSPFSPCKDPRVLLSLRFSAWWKFSSLDGQVMQPLFKTTAFFLWAFHPGHSGAGSMQKPVGLISSFSHCLTVIPPGRYLIKLRKSVYHWSGSMF